MKNRIWLLGLLFFCFACKQENPKVVPKVDEKPNQNYKIVPSEISNIHFTNNIQESSNFNYLIYPFIYFGGGVATGDINNDGLPDIYFTSNMGQNILYLNQGNLKFLDITKSAGVEGKYNHWTTGVTMADVNNDGYLDYYVSVAGPGDTRKNLLYINQKDNSFKEEAEKYGIADAGHSIQSSFFDFDNDGDLDLYVGNYPIAGFSQKSDFFYEKTKKLTLDESDKLYRNDNGVFVDITKQSGILNYGLTLGLSISDFNTDGLPDIYVSNDFNSPDYLYINQGDNTFFNEILKYTGHTSNFGMGIDTGDINNDGHMDLLQLDMMGSTNAQQKANMSAMNTALFYDMVDKGLHHQYMKNTLQLNTGNESFIEIGELAGISYTDWSWGSLLMDMDNDGFKDIFITNGMRRNVNDNDFNALFRIQKAYGKVDQSQYVDWLKRMPVQPIENVAFKNSGDLRFKKTEKSYGLSFEGFSNGSSYADLDLDGDLDLIVNNLSAKSQIYKNTASASDETNFLRIKLKGKADNAFGIGTRIEVYSGEKKQVEELYLTRGYESSVEPILHFGLGGAKKIDSILIDWPKGAAEVLYNVTANQVLEIEQGKGVKTKKSNRPIKQLFAKDELRLNPNYIHRENTFNDFEREILLPHRMSQFGPALAISDINADGLDDFYVGGAMGFSGKLYLQKTDGSFQAISNSFWNTDKAYEDVSATFFDANNDNFQDLYVVSGGNEKKEGDKIYQDRLYINNQKGGFLKSKSILPEIYNSGSCVRVIDYDKDGDKDLFIGGRQVPGKYPTPTSSYILRNDSTPNKVLFNNVTVEIAPDLLDIGMVTDASFIDVDKDGWQDLIVVGEWMSPKILKNNKGVFEDKSSAYGLGLTSQVGWWNCIVPADIDNDGDLDFITGNLGLNYKYQTSVKEPFKIFANDFDDSGTLDIVLGYYESGFLYPLRGRECSSQQIPSIKKKFENYTAFSKASLEDVYSKEQLGGGMHYEATTFASTVFINESGKFVARPLPNYAQTSSINAIEVLDINQDGNLDLFLGGNLLSSEVETPRNDASYGLLALGDGKGGFQPLSSKESGFYVKGEIRAIQSIKNNKKEISFLIARNNDELVLVKKSNSHLK